jgi:squalene synthase HpnC
MAVGHYENFPVASILMPPRFRRPVALIYRFAREADDFADEGDLLPAERLALLDNFSQELDRIDAGQPPDIPWFNELASMIREHALPVQLFRDLLSAFSQDVVKERYADYPEVLDYCRRSANPIGRMLLILYGTATSQNNTWGDAICTSLQLINFWQDVAIDYRKNRIYFPQDEMAQYGINESVITQATVNDTWCKFLRFQVNRTRQYLHSGAPLGRVLKGRLGLEMRMIIAGGDRILTKIENVNFDVFQRRPVLKPHDWLLMLARSAI